MKTCWFVLTREYGCLPEKKLQTLKGKLANWIPLAVFFVPSYIVLGGESAYLCTLSQYLLSSYAPVLSVSNPEHFLSKTVSKHKNIFLHCQYPLFHSCNCIPLHTPPQSMLSSHTPALSWCPVHLYDTSNLVHTCMHTRALYAVLKHS